MAQVPRDKPVATYLEFLSQTKVAKSRRILNATLKQQMNWHGSFPLSTALAIQNGTFMHENSNFIGPFSAFAMIPLALSGCDPAEYLNLQLKSSEGKGLDNADVTKTTKLVLSVPLDVHELGFFITGFIHLLGYVFGPASLVATAVQSWSPHMIANISDYQDCFNADPLFGVRVLTLIDRKVQRYLAKGLNPSTRGRAESHLAFGQYQLQIEDKEFSYQNLPANILTVYQKRVAEKGSLGPAQAARALPVQNPLPLPSFHAEPDFARYLLSGVNTNGPTWGKDGPACPRYHLEGFCSQGDSCKYAATHRPPAESEANDYRAWMRPCDSRCRQRQDEKNSPPATRQPRRSRG